MKRQARQRRILAILIAAAAAAAPAHAGWQAHYSPEGISATGFFEHFGGGGEGTRIERSPARRINLGSIGRTQWAPEAPAAGPAPVNALHEETVKRFRHAGIGGDNTP